MFDEQFEIVVLNCHPQFRLAWDKFTAQLLFGRHQHNHRRHKNKHLRHLLNCPSGSPKLKPSASVHLSMKEIVSNESQSAYVMANTVGGQTSINLPISPPITRYLLQQQRRHPSCLIDEPETSVTYQQAIRMKSCRNFLQDQPEEEVIKTVMLAVRSISGSVTNDNPNEDSVFFQQTSFTEDTNDIGLVHHGNTVPSQSPIRLPATTQSNQNDRRDIDVGSSDGEPNAVIGADNIIRISYITASVDC